MRKNSPKYSIIIPAHNGGEYLPACVDTIISQPYDDYELIISDDHSTDGTKEYLNSLASNNKVRAIFPEVPLSMTEHWEWALTHATGEWLIFVGQDDGLQPYFFEHADTLIPLAEKAGVRTIMSRRAYFFWEGSQFKYGDVAVSYAASNLTKVKNSKYEALKALLGAQLYFELPEMYTTAIFHNSILEQARILQDGKVLTCHPQDANLAAIACSLDSQYLRTEIPLGWVGTSRKSAGLAISSATSHADELKELRDEYKDKIKNSGLGYHPLAGDFSFGDIPVYFWQTLIKTPKLRDAKTNNLLISKPFKYLFFSALLARLLTKKIISEKRETFINIIQINDCSKPIVWSIAIFLILLIALSKIFFKAKHFIGRLKRLIQKKLSNNSNAIFIKRSVNPGISILEASNLTLNVYKKIKIERK